MDAVTEVTFYDRFNEALLNEDCHLASNLLLHALNTFEWSKENRMKLSSMLQELG